MLQRIWRGLLVPAVALAVVGALVIVSREPTVAEDERARLAERFRFVRMDLDGDPAHARTVRRVAPGLARISAWISAVGAAVAIADIAGSGRDGDVCLVDPRDDSVTVRPAPGTGDRFTPFRLTPQGLWWNPATMAPMGCVPGDFNQDGRTDLLVSYWGRSPVLYLRRDGLDRPPTTDGFQSRELISPPRIWNTETVNIADVDGDGRPDVIVGNYFADGARVLDPEAGPDPLMKMQDGMSNAAGAGTTHVLRWKRGLGGAAPDASFQEEPQALPPDARTSWTLATGAQDLTGDGLPELYLANDFGRDHLLVNRSSPGRVRFTTAAGPRTPSTPKSKVVGRDSFKGMGVAFAQLSPDPLPHILVSNITLPYALQESNFVFAPAGTADDLLKGVAPYQDRSEELGLSRSGWAWDIKTGDFTNSGEQQILQAVGFIKGETNRWPQLQELAMTNDSLLREPIAWPDFGPGDDLSGAAHNRFFVRTPQGRYTDLSPMLDLEQETPSRSFALADTDADGRLDFAVANQWGRSTFYRNAGPVGDHVGLRLRVPAPAGRDRALTPAIGARVTVSAPGSPTQTQQVYPANGHTGVSSPDLLFGLGDRPLRDVTAEITWRDSSGLHRITRTLRPGWHTVILEHGSSNGGRRGR
ncbi:MULTISPECIES: CRTAC1 family protein [unclassified Nonomuraea]|uniref:CRTAC1 family protein n=1 Tax=unclassified Nonomuraea TaxID=2593643 RepID=UPI003410E6B6